MFGHFTNPAFSAHFSIFSMVTGGYDRGGFEFELENIIHHLRFYCERLQQDFSDDLVLKVYGKIDNDVFESKLMNKIESMSNGIRIVEDESDNIVDYYQTVRIKIIVKYHEKEIHMKKDIRTVSTADENNKEFDLEPESVNDIIERIEGLSYEGRRHIIAYLKAKSAKRKKERK